MKIFKSVCFLNDTKKKLTSGGFDSLKQSLKTEGHLRWGPLKIWNFTGQKVGFCEAFWTALSTAAKQLHDF